MLPRRGWSLSRAPAPGCLAIAIAIGCSDRGAAATPVPERVSPSSAPVITLIGEVHLHQFPRGAHGWAAFLSTGVPIADVQHDELAELESAPTASLDGCTLYVQPTCSPACGKGTLCLAPNACTPYSPSANVDLGEVRIHGSRTVPLIRMWFLAPQSPYACDPAPGPQQLFTGGERLEIAGGSGDYAFEGAIVAPSAVAVTAPNLDLPLHLPRDASLHVTWTSDASPHIVVTISASSRDGRSASIRCSTADTGALDVPRAFLAALPPPPRDTRLEVERQYDRILPMVRPGLGVFVHAAQSTWKNGSDALTE